jgi:hypothetical protein
MEVVKALFIGLLAGFGIATIGHGMPGSVGDIARWHSSHFILLDKDWHFSMPLFIGFSIFAFPFVFWLRK